MEAIPILHSMKTVALQSQGGHVQQQLSLILQGWEQGLKERASILYTKREELQTCLAMLYGEFQFLMMQYIRIIFLLMQ